MVRCMFPFLSNFMESSLSPSNQDLFVSFSTCNDNNDETSHGSLAVDDVGVHSVQICRNNQKSHEQMSNRRTLSNSIVILKMDAFSGALVLPSYQPMARDSCPLLRNAWSENWNKVVDICTLEPHRALHVTEHSCRTALHLATFSHKCPLYVAQSLLAANRHMVLVRDSNMYTPLHIVAFFNNHTDSIRRTSMDSDNSSDINSEVEESMLMSLFCDTAIMVEQELQNDTLIPPAYGTSPLFLAAKRNASLSILITLLETRKRTSWIAPSTGGEPYWDCQTLDEYSSPLEVLLRDSNRASLHMNIDKLRRNPKRVTKMREIAIQRLSRRRRSNGQGPKLDITLKSIQESAAVPTTLNGIVSSDGSFSSSCSINALTDFDDCCSFATLEDEQDCLLLWEKCVELLVGYCPLLEVGDDESHIPYGILHAVTCCKVPIPSLVQVVLLLFPEQAWQRDEQGMIPLHHVLRGRHKYATKTLLHILLTGTTPPSSSKHPHHSIYPFPNPRYFHSTALIPLPNNGPYPLAFALQQGLPMDNVIQKLLDADSDVTLLTIDPITGLYPFCLAALARSCEEENFDSNEDLVETLAPLPLLNDTDGLWSAFSIPNNTVPDFESVTRNTELYKLDDIYRLLLAQPQVLTHYMIETK